jgi:hypothetical protein
LWPSLLDAYDVLGLRAFGARDHVELYLLTFREGFKTFALKGGEMYEDVFATFTLDKAVAFAVIEPLDFAFFTHS